MTIDSNDRPVIEIDRSNWDKARTFLVSCGSVCGPLDGPEEVIENVLDALFGVEGWTLTE